MAEAFVRITHPDIAGDATVALSAVPGHAARGWLVTGRIDGGTAPSPVAPQLTRPGASGSTDAWRTYAVAAYVLGAAGGLTYDDAMSMSRDQLVAHFANLPDPADVAETPDPTSQES